MEKFTLRDLVLNALVAATYIVLVFVFMVLSFETIQFRIAEALLILILFNKKLSPGLLLATFVVNLFSPLGIIDAFVGSTATFLAIVLMLLFKKQKYLSLIFPAITNGLIVGLMISYVYQTPFYINFIFVFLGEAVVMYTVGLFLYLYINKNDNILKLIT